MKAARIDVVLVARPLFMLGLGGTEKEQTVQGSAIMSSVALAWYLVLCRSRAYALPYTCRVIASLWFASGAAGKTVLD